MPVYTPEDSVENLSAEFVNDSGEYCDWERADLIDGQVYSAETCSECGQVCVMDYIGENSHADWMDGHEDDEDVDYDRPKPPTDMFDDYLWVGANVTAYIGFNYRLVDGVGFLVQLRVVDGEVVYDPTVSEDQLLEVDTDESGIVEAVDLDESSVLVRFNGREHPIRFIDYEAGTQLEVVYDDVYEALKRQNKTAAQCDETLYNQGPMMNYRYPIDVRRAGGPREAAIALQHLPLTIVGLDGDYWLALTGGGMDYGWEIAEGYMRLGYLPPQFVHDLPRMAGRKLSDPRTKWVLEGVRRAARVQQDWAQQTLDRLEAYWAELEAKESQNVS